MILGPCVQMYEDNLKRLAGAIATVKTGVGVILLQRREGSTHVHPCRPDNAQLLSSFGAFGLVRIFIFRVANNLYKWMDYLINMLLRNI